MKHVAPSFLLPVFFAVAASAVLPGPVSPTAGIPAGQFLSEPEPVPFVSDDGAWCDVAVVDGLTWAYAVVGGAGNESARVGVFARIRAVPTSAAGHVAIPHSFEGAPVTAIDGMAFYGCDRLVSVVVPDGVESIGDYAFYGCTALESVSLPESATNIAATAFEGCPLLSSSASPDRFRAAPSAAPPENKDGPDAENAVCVVSFDANGGSVDVSTAEYPAGEVLGHLPLPVREGHVFDGWYDSPIPGMGSLVTTQTVAPGIVLSLFARWSLPDTDPWQPVFRFYSKNYKGHFYTMDPAESATLMCTNPNWKYEGVAYYAAKTQLDGTVPLYRFYSKNYRGHFYTIDEEEMRTVRDTNPNWKYEGIAFFVYPDGDSAPNGTATPVFRFWSKIYRHHFYTISEAEMQTIRDTNPNWKYENVAFWTQAAPPEILRYDVVFDGNGATSGATAPFSAVVGRLSTLPENGFVRPGWSFAGWATNATGRAVWQPGETVRLDLASRAGETATLYAAWTGDPYTVAFDANAAAATGTMDPQTFFFGEAQALRRNAFALPGHAFVGWATTPEGLAVYEDGQSVVDLASVSQSVVTLHAKWSAVSFRIRFNANGGSGAMSDQVFVYGTAQDLAANAFSFDGHVFAGWATNPTGPKVYDDRQSVSNLTETAGGTVELHAVWTPNTYAVRFDKNSSAATGTMADQTFTYGRASPLRANSFARTGHAFAGWATSPTGPKVYDDRQSVSNLVATAGETMDLYAKWTANEYSVRFNKNAPDATGSMADESFVYGAAKALTANAFSRAGYTFAGWATSATGAKVYDDRQSVSNLSSEQGAIVDLYAVWTANGYSVKFNANTTGTTGSMSNESFTYGVAKALTANAFAKTGYRFAGWARTAAGAKAFDDKQTVSNLTATAGAVVNLYALWSTNAYTVRFNKNASDATGTMANQTFAYDRASALRANSFARTDYTFAGWATSPTGAKVYNDKQSVSNLTATHGATVDLYAVWTANGYSVKFNANTTGTTGSMSNESFTYGVAKALTANAFAKTGYRFAGWARTAAGAKAFDDKQTVSNLTATAGAVVNLYALWSTNAYTVRFNKNASDATGTMANQTFAYDRASALRANSFARTDYTFAGWATSPTGAKVYNDKQSVSNLTATHGATVDLYAVWTCNSLYAVIDLSAGSSASSYPVTYLSSPPSGGFNTDEYKTKKLVLRRIEPGSFKMRGSVNVTLTKPFYIGLFEVTQKQYQLVTGSNPAKFQGDKRPVEYVSYNNIRGTSNGAKWPESNAVDASSFMGKLRARTGLVCDLPTEAQWEYACRAGTTSSYNNGGSSENDLKQLGRYSGNTSDGKGGYSSYHTTVGSYLPNAWGLYDMHGNVWEWCLDWHGSITGGTDPKGPSSGTQRELRGGSDRSEASLCVSGRAASNLPYGDGGKIDNGFRLAFSP